MSPILRHTTPVFALLALAGAPLAAQVRLRKDPAVFQADGQSPVRSKALPLSRTTQLAAPGRVRLNALTVDESNMIGTFRGNRRIGVHRDLPENALRSGTWTTLADGRRAWRLSIGSASASGVRVHFSDFEVGQGQVWLYAEGTTETDGPYTAEGPFASGDFWSSTIDGENVVIEY